MPGNRIHGLGAALFLGIVLFCLVWLELYSPSPLVMAGLIAAGALGGLFPDVDTDSRGQRLYYGLLLAVDVALIADGEFKWAAILGVVAMLPAIGVHRGFTHSWWAMFVMPLPVLLLPALLLQTPFMTALPFYLAALLGYMSHLLLDRRF